MQVSTKRHALGLSSLLTLCVVSLGTSYAADDGSAKVSNLGAPTSVIEAHAMDAANEFEIAPVVYELVREGMNGNQFPRQQAFPASQFPQFFGFSASNED